MDREDVAELIQRYTLIAIPVVDHEGRLVGMVKVSEAMEAIQAEAGEDIAIMFGAGEQESVLTPVRESGRRRLPWNLFNLAAGFITVFIVAQFEGTLARYALLAAFMPLVAGLSGNSGAQAIAVTIRSLAVNELPRGREMRAVRRELAIGLLRALCKRLRAADNKIGGLVLLDVPGRVAKLLLEMADENDGQHITRKITHHMIAQMIGSSRETVSRTMRTLSDRGLIQVTRKAIIVQDRDALKTAAGRP